MSGGYIFSQLQVYPCVWYKKEMVPLYYVDDCLMFSLSKNKIGEVYVSLQEYFKTEDDGYLKKYLEIDLDCLAYGLINIRQPYPT